MAEEGRTELAGLIDRVWPEWTCSRTWWPRACRPHPRATVGCSIENGPLPSLNCRNASTRALPPRSRHRTPRHRSWKRDGVRSAGPTHRMTAPSGCDRRLGWRLGRQTGWSTQRDCDGAGRDLDTGASLARRSGLRAGTFAPCSSLRTWGVTFPNHQAGCWPTSPVGTPPPSIACSIASTGSPSCTSATWIRTAYESCCVNAGAHRISSGLFPNSGSSLVDVCALQTTWPQDSGFWTVELSQKIAGELSRVS